MVQAWHLRTEGEGRCLLQPVLLLQVLSICAAPSKSPPSNLPDNVCVCFHLRELT